MLERRPRRTDSRYFASAGEFLESVEDSKDSIWLVHIVYGNSSGTSHVEYPCGSSRTQFLSKSTWSRLTAHTSDLGILSAVFDCQKDILFCHQKGWHRPRLLLGLLSQNSEYIELYNNENQCEYTSIMSWLEMRLRSQLKSQTSRRQIVDKMRIIYQTSRFDQLPIYFTASMIKFARMGANLSVVASHVDLNCSNQLPHTTPIVLKLDSTCYNYGASLNELPHYLNLNLFLTFLYPDSDSILLTTLFFLNTYLVFCIFEYRRSLLKQIVYGVVYVFIVNFIVFFLWLILTNLSFLSLDESFMQLRHFLLTYPLIFKLLGCLRFSFFYFIYINPYMLLAVYLVFGIFFYTHTKLKSQKREKSRLLPLVEETVRLMPPQQQQFYFESDSEQHTVSNLINQINGITTIWLSSTTLADKVLLELPTIELCKCIKRLARLADRARSYATSSGFSEEEDEQKLTDKPIQCECGRNDPSYLSGLRETDFINISRECSICLEKYSFEPSSDVNGIKSIVRLPCGHFFHRKCLNEWFMTCSSSCNCPFCRLSLFRPKKSI